MFLTVVTPTHDPKYLPELWESLEKQTLEYRWEWLIAPTLATADAVRAMLFAKSPRVRIAPFPGLLGNVGAAKLWAFTKATELELYTRVSVRKDEHEHVLVELDHDDLLLPTALQEISFQFANDPELGFVYSDAIDWSPTGDLVTYLDPMRRAAWMAEGWKFGASDEALIYGLGGGFIEGIYPFSWEPSAKAFAEVLYAPNHVRAWRADTYQRVLGHDPSRKVCDDLDLVQRTYLHAKVKRIPKPLYAYRVDGGNTWLSRVHEIQGASKQLMSERLHDLVVREMTNRELPLFDLGGGIDPAPGPWQPVDCAWPEGFRGDARTADLRGRWPFEDSSVGAFRAFDLLEHLPDRLHTMREIYRCLAPGGWLLSRTPSCAGPGAYRDPTHESLWVRDSFRYYTEAGLGRYLPGGYANNPRFMAAVLEEDVSELPYIRADLVSLKDDDGRLPGRRCI